MDDLRHGRVEMDLAAEFPEIAAERLDHGVRTALADDHAKGLVGHRLEVGKQRAA